ncbi:MAG: alanine racemase [Thermoanaerobaculia bacterium]|nr:alanine racemase [Thermoanaerobaculia bacterium]
MRPTEAIIDLAALRSNLEVARRLAPTSRILAVVKANAYGHGAERVSAALTEYVDAFGVATITEALALRVSGIERPILLLEGFFEAAEIPDIVQHRLDIVIGNEEQLHAFLAADLHRPLRVWLKVDTGMHRLGFCPEKFDVAYSRLKASDAVADIIVMSHFAEADRTEGLGTPTQLALFESKTAHLNAPASLANSAAVLAWPSTHRDWIRPGLMLYGLSPLDRLTSEADTLRPVMTLRSSLSLVRTVEAGEAIGYGGRSVCAERTRVGVVPLGYADGYPREAPDGTPVLVAGRPSRVLGQVSMDMITVDLENIPEAQVGTPVELWGAELSATDVAEIVGTINYTLITGVSARVPRRYV